MNRTAQQHQHASLSSASTTYTCMCSRISEDVASRQYAQPKHGSGCTVEQLRERAEAGDCMQIL